MRPPCRTSQAGFIIYAVVLMLLLGVASVGLTFYRPPSQVAVATGAEHDVFAEVKTALIGYATRQGVFQCSDPSDAAACTAELNASGKLGEFPCPDTDGDGFAQAACATARIGRVPWKTLGIAEPKDRAGETLWYAVSLRWLGNASNPIVRRGDGYVTSGIINSATPGDITVLGSDGSTVTTTAIAVILSSGGLLPAQARNSALATCGATANVPRNLCAANYLETLGGGNNTVAGGPFIAGTAGSAFNDRLVYVGPSEVVPSLEMRLGSELRKLLIAYKYNSKCFCYPWADSWNYSGGIGDYGVNRGRLASNAAISAPKNTGEPENWGTGSIPAYPPWLKDNDWNNQLFYMASDAETNQTLRGCLTCSTNAYLTVKSTPAVGAPSISAAAIILTPGTPRPGVNRPYLGATLIDDVTVANAFPSYFEDAANTWATCPGINTEHSDSPGSFAQVTAAAACDTVIQPQSRAYDRDRLFVLAPEAPATICSRGGAALYNATPCHDPQNKDANQVNPVCTDLIAKLQTCSAACAAAATQMGVVPCRNTRNANQCGSYQATLLACKP